MEREGVIERGREGRMKERKMDGRREGGTRGRKKQREREGRRAKNNVYKLH